MTAPRRLEYSALEELAPAVRNPKRHDLPTLVASLKRFGFTAPALVDERTGRLVAGHGRLAALAAIRDAGDPLPEGVGIDGAGRWVAPVIRGWASSNDAEADAYLVADNRLTEAGGWDDAELVALLGELAEGPGLAGVGYGADDLEAMLRRYTGDASPGADPDVVPEPPADPYSRPGDLWHLGAHRLVCGDATDTDVVALALAGEPADLVFTSPPYNVGVGYSGHDDATATWAEYSTFLQAAVDAFVPHVAPGRAVAWNIGTSPKTFPARQQVLLEDAGLAYFRTLVWEKVGVPVPLWHFTAADPRARQLTPNYKHELVLVYRAGDAPDDGDEPDPARAVAAFTQRPFEPAPAHELVVVFARGAKLAKGAGVTFDQTLEHDVFTVNQSAATRGLPDAEPGARRTGTQGNLKRRSAKAHPAPFPVALPEAFIAHLADVGGWVLDPFAGSGSTLIAAVRTGRRGAGVELDPAYVDLACWRYQHLTGDTPHLERDGQPAGPVDFSKGRPE